MKKTAIITRNERKWIIYSEMGKIRKSGNNQNLKKKS